MAVRKINESTLTAIGNAIRSKTGGSALINPEDMASEIDSIQTGGSSIANGIEIVDYYANGKIKEINAVGNVPPSFMQYWWYNSSPVKVNLVSNPTHIGDSAFNAAFVELDNSYLEGVETADSWAFVVAVNGTNNLSSKTLSLPSFTGGGSSNSTSRFRSQATQFYGNYYLPKMQEVHDYDWYQNKVANVSIQIGSIGNPLQTCGNYPFGGASGSGTITVYTTGSLLDGLRTKLQQNAGANYSFVYKASENTEYGGVSYQAGDTMLTS